MKKRIQISDRSLFPVQAFFNAIDETEFVEVMDHLSHGISGGFNEAICEFPSSLDPDEEAFDGVRFSLLGEVAIISKDQLKRFAEEDTKSHVTDYPHDKEKLEYVIRNF